MEFVVSRLGERIYVDPDDERVTALRMAGGELNRGSTRLWDLVLAMREWDVVVDIGANYGEMLLGARLPERARLLCFEPNPRVTPFLRRSIAESRLDVELREIAVGPRDGRDTFAMDVVWSGRSGLLGSHRTDADHAITTLDVPVRTLDSELSLSDGESVCLKVDVEGGEHDVLRGASELLGSGRPWAMMLEILHMDAFEKARLANEFSMSVLDDRTGELVAVPPTTPGAVSELLTAGWIYPQDAVLTARVKP
jgi:FkbM family methyltransferase